MDSLLKPALPIVVDFCAFLFIPPIACSTGIFIEKCFSLGSGGGGELLAILCTVITAVIAYGALMEILLDTIDGPRNKWWVWAVLVVLNFVYIFWVTTSCIKASAKAPPVKFGSGFGSTVFGCYFTSVIFHLLKFVPFTYFFFVLSELELP